MADFLMESMLNEYFTDQVILGRFLAEPEKLFFRLSEIYLVERERAEALFLLTEREEVRQVDSLRAYMQYCRLRQYCQLENVRGLPEQEVMDIISLKGAAIERAVEEKLLPVGEKTARVVHTILTEAVTRGCIPALRIVGVLCAEGIFFDKDREAGVELLARAAKWNDIEALFELIYYDEDKRETLLQALRYLLKERSRSGDFELVASHYFRPAEGLRPEVKLVEKAFRAEVLNRADYAPDFARLIFSRIISDMERERLIFSGGKELPPAVSELPLKLKFRQISAGEPPRLKGREREHEEIAMRLKNIELRDMETYRPLCLVSNSKFLLNLYAASMFREANGVHVESIEVSDLSDYDLEPSFGNILVRSCDEDAANVYLFFFRGNVSERHVSEVKRFLHSAQRKRFRLIQPVVCLDLSSILPVCFCDRQNAEQLGKVCDIVDLDNISQNEKEFFIEQILSFRAKLYGFTSVTLSEDGMERIGSKTIDIIERVIDRAVRDSRGSGDELVLTAEKLGGYLNDNRGSHPFGFGGETHEDH